MQKPVEGTKRRAKGSESLCGTDRKPLIRKDTKESVFFVCRNLKESITGYK